jgi:multidrug efflux pump subunit AcrB
MLFTVLTLAGFALTPFLSVRFLPSSLAPGLTVRFSWPGAGPEAVEREVVAPMEGAFSLVSGIEKIYSVSSNGSGSVRLELDEKADREYLRFEIAAKVRQIYPGLPGGVSYPQVLRNMPEKKAGDLPLLTWSLTGNDSPAALHRYASEVLMPQLALIPGLYKTETAGGNAEEWVVEYDAAQLKISGFDKADILRALQQTFHTESLGTATENGRIYYTVLRNSGNNIDNITPQKNGKERLENIVIGKAGSRLLRLGDVAKVSFREQAPRQYYRINGQSGVRLIQYAEAGVNTIQLAAAVKKRVAELKKNLPPGYRIYLNDDATKFLDEELLKIKQRTLWSLSVLLGFVLVAYRNWRYPAIILSSLLANLGLAALLYYFIDVELNLYALAGVTVSLGMVIDNSVVMMHHLRSQGNLRIFPALLASTLTTLAALAVIRFLPEIWQLNLAEFARVLAINLGVSLVVAIWLIPALMAKFGVSKNHEKNAPAASISPPPGIASRLYRNSLLLLLRFRKTAILGVVLLFGLPVFWLPDKIEGWAFYNETLGNAWFKEHVKPLTDKALGGMLRLFSHYVRESGNFRQPEETVLYLQGAMPPGATLAQMNEVFEKTDAFLAQFPVEIRKFVTSVSSGEFATTQIFFNENYDVSFPPLLKSRLIVYCLNLAGVKWNIYGVGQGFSNDNSSTPPRFRVKILGYRQDELRKQSERLAEKLLQHPRIGQVNTEANIDWWEKDRYAWEMRLDRRALAEKNIPAYRLRQVFDDFNRGENPDYYLPGSYPVRLANKAADNNDLWRLLHVSQQVDSLRVLFTDVGSLEKMKAAAAIYKEDQQYIRIVEFEYTGSHHFGSRFLDEKIAEMRLEMPPGYTIQALNKDWEQATTSQYGLLALVAGLIFFICTLTFESLKQAAFIVLLVPLSFIGIFLTFYGFGFPFDQGGYTSFLMVAGLTVNSLILIVNDFNGLRRRDPSIPPLDLYTTAFLQKWTPIALSVLSTVLGLLPFTFHGQQEVFWFSLAVGTIGGLVFSLIVIAWLIPLFFVGPATPGIANYNGL